MFSRLLLAAVLCFGGLGVSTPAHAGRADVFNKRFKVSLRSPRNETLTLCQHFTHYTAFAVPAFMENHGYVLCIEPPTQAELLKAPPAGPAGANVPGGIMQLVDGRQRFYPLTPEVFRAIRAAQPDLPAVLPGPTTGDWITGFVLWPLLAVIGLVAGLIKRVNRIPRPELPPAG